MPKMISNPCMLTVGAILLMGWNTAVAAPTAAQLPPELAPPVMVSMTDGTAQPYPGVYQATRYLPIVEGTASFKVFATAAVQDWFLRQTTHVIRNMVKAIKPELRSPLTGVKVLLICEQDPTIPASRTNGDPNTGGWSGVTDDGMGTAMVVFCSPEIVCGRYRDNYYRGWDTPIHEFGHAIEMRLGLRPVMESIYGTNDPWISERFTWNANNWFISIQFPDYPNNPYGTYSWATRNDLPGNVHNALAQVFDTGNTWVQVPTDLGRWIGANRFNFETNMENDYRIKREPTHVSFIEQNNYIGFQDFNFNPAPGFNNFNPATRIDVSVASPYSGGKIEVFVGTGSTLAGSTKIGEISGIPKTGGWSSYVTRTCNLTQPVSGFQNLFFRFSGTTSNRWKLHLRDFVLY